MGTVAIQTQCCLQQRDDKWETDEEEGAREETVQLVEPVPWHGSSGGSHAGAPPRAPAAVPRSLSDATVAPTGKG